MVAWWVVAIATTASVLKAQDGTLQWPFTVTLAGGISFSSPALSPDGSTVYIGVINASSGTLWAITREGAEKWKRNFTRFIDSSPAVSADGSTVYIGVGDGRLYALNASNGAIRWQLNIGAFITSSPAIGADGTLYFGAADSRLHAVADRGAAGQELWSYPTGDVIDSSPAIAADGTIYFGSWDRRVYALTPEGALKWEAPFQTGGRIFASPAIGADGTIYIGSGDQRLYALTPQGTKLWDHLTNGDIQASPVIGVDGTIYFAADVSFYALRPGINEERLRWRVSINSSSASTAAVRGDGAIIFGADDGMIRALRPEDGRNLWPPFDTKTGPGNLIESSPIVAPDGSIYIGSTDGNLYKLNGNGSPLSQHSPWPAFRRDMRHTGRAIEPNSGGALVNISTRALAGDGRNLIAGFVVRAPTRGAYLVRAAGPSLSSRDVGGFMPDPLLELFSGQVMFQANDNWPEIEPGSGVSHSEIARSVEAFALEPGSKDAAVLTMLPTGAFTAAVRSADRLPGVALVEVYDIRYLGDPNARLLNLSTRGFVGTGENMLIAGFVVGGSGPMRLLLRGIGPSLAQFGVSGVLQQPRLRVFSGATEIASNTVWATGGFKRDLVVASASAGAFPLDENRADSALLFDARPGPYTIQISGVGGTTGEAMVEIYVLP